MMKTTDSIFSEDYIIEITNKLLEREGAETTQVVGCENQTLC